MEARDWGLGFKIKRLTNPYLIPKPYPPIFENDPGGNEARKTRAHNAVRGSGIVADLKEALDRSLMGRS
jgi:hypothetical protein